MRRVMLLPVLVIAFTMASCSASPTPPAADPPSGEAPQSTQSADPIEEAGAGVVGDACALLDEEYLNSALAGVESTFGGALEFQEPLQTPPSAFCSWRDASGGISIELLLEDAATSETGDHSERTYNIDVEPTVELQDGPGENAVLLVDTAFTDLGSEGLPYGYFFVADGIAVYVKAVGVDIGRDMLRTLADEASARMSG